VGRRIVADSSLGARLGPELDRCVGESPWSSRALSLRSTIALVQRRWPDARRDLEAALAVDPALEKGYHRLAYALLMSGDPRGALEQIGRAWRLGMSDAFIDTLASQAHAMIRRRDLDDARPRRAPDSRSSLRRAMPAADPSLQRCPPETSSPWFETSSSAS